jgi:hypothetical protein
MAATHRPDPSSAAERVRTSSWLSALMIAVGIGGIGTAIGNDRPRTLLASSGGSCPDADSDGLIDVQEDILGTYPDASDSDQDGYSDLEEVARASDPLDPDSMPEDHDLSIGLTARAENGVITLVAPIYAKTGSFGQIDLEFGLVFPDGSRYELLPILYLPVITGGVYSPQKQNYRVVVLEMPFPESLVQGFGSISLYGTVEDPFASSVASAAALNLIDFSGVTVMAQNPPAGLGAGVIYAPIVPDSEIPASWSTGQICWHEASPVGMVGSSTAYEVTKGSCVSSDTYCSTTDCTSLVGMNMMLVDPATLLGG